MPGADTRGVPYPYPLLAALVLCFTLLPAHAAGGHFDVDDATTAGEWAAGDAASVLLEHSRIVGERVSRLGGRWNLSSRLSLDLSLSRHRPAEAGGYTGATLGLNQDFGG